MFLRDQLSSASERVDQVRVYIAIVIFLHGAVVAVVGAEGNVRVLGRRDVGQRGVGQLNQLLFTQMIDGAIGAIAVCLSADLLHRLYVVVFPVPKVESGAILGRSRVNGFLSALRRATEKQMLSILRKTECSPVADRAAGLEPRWVAGHKFGGRGTLVVPQLEFEFRLLGRSVAATSQERQLRLLLLPDQFPVLAFARQHCSR